MRTYIAGIGSSGAILCAIAAAFVVLGAIVSTEGLPIGSANSSDAAVRVDSNAPEAAAAAATLASLAPAEDPAPTAAAGTDGGGTGSGAGGAAGSAPSGGESLDPGPLPDGTVDPTDPPGPVDPTPPPPPGGGGVSGIVDNVDQSVENATGINPGLGDLTGPATGAVDQTLGNLNDRALGGGALPGLGG